MILCLVPTVLLERVLHLEAKAQLNHYGDNCCQRSDSAMGTAVLHKLQIPVSTRASQKRSSQKRNIRGLWQLCHWKDLKVYVHPLTILLPLTVPLIFLGQGHCNRNMRVSENALLGTGIRFLSFYNRNAFAPPKETTITKTLNRCLAFSTAGRNI